MPPRRLVSLVASCIALVAAFPSAAAASHTQTTSFEAPVELRSAATLDAALDEIASFGARSLRVVMYWQDVAPAPTSRVKPAIRSSDPAAYDWSVYDGIVAGAKQRGFRVLMTVSGPVPRWATNGALDNLTRPSPQEFAQFMEAAGRHFGRQIDQWAVWNEPNHPQFLLPQYSARTHKPLSPAIYRKLYVAGRRGLRDAGLGDVPVLIGETSPRGTGKVVAPLTFLRGVLCLDGRYRRTGHCTRLGADGYAHHAYTTGEGPFFRPPGPNDVTIGVLGRLVSALNRAAAAGAIDRRLPIYLTEFGIQSFPDRIAGVSLPRQADFRSIAERIAYDTPRVVAFSQYLLRDDPPVPGARGQARYAGFQSGVRTFDGKPKPALNGFRLSLAALHVGTRTSLWGLVRPAQGRTTALIQERRGSTWRDLRQVTTDVRGYLTLRIPFRSGARYRLVWTAPGGQTFQGSTTRVYRR